jgi:hypothetical protein
MIHGQNTLTLLQGEISMLRMFPLWLLLAGLGLASYDAFLTRGGNTMAPSSPGAGAIHSLEDGTGIPPIKY